MFTIGQIVFSKRGRDKGKPFIIINVEDEYVYLVDGDLRKVANPKKKKCKHIQITNDVSSEINIKIKEHVNILDSDIRKALLPYKNAVCKGNKEVINLV